MIVHRNVCGFMKESDQNKLDPPHSHHLSFAQGWVELGDADEARQELDKMDSRFRNHPDVLEVSWLVFSEKTDWDQAAVTARQIKESAPDRASGWIHYAYSMRRLHGSEAAMESLEPASRLFPDEPVIPYNLACYACLSGDKGEAEKWLRLAMSIGNPKIIRKMALNDEDLESMWPKIPSMRP